jgi:prepilin-type N-terminal cleavage/methylation domain-containing protein
MKHALSVLTAKVRPTTKSKGFSLIEVILASSVFALLVTALVGAFLYGQEGTALAGTRARAVFLAEEGLEAVRNIRDAGFVNLVDGTYGLATTGNQWSLVGSSDLIDIFTRQIIVSTVDANRKSVTANITWQQNLQRTGSVVLTSYLTNWSRSSTPTTCDEYALQQGYSLGTCRQNIQQCTNNGETYLSEGDIFCTGGPSANTCCALSIGGGDIFAPSAITNLVASNATQSTILLTWMAPGDDGITGTATSYDIRYATSIITEANWASAMQVTGEPTPSISGTIETMTIIGLSANTTYYFAIKTADEVPNISALSNVPNLATSPLPDTTPPAAITNLSLSTPTINSILLSWTAPGDDGITGTATSYDIRYSTSLITEVNWASATQVTGEPTPLLAGSNQTMTVSSLSANTTYYFAMKTSDEVPNISALSNVPSLATLPLPDTTPPAAITNLSLSSASGKSILLTWTAPGDDGNTGTATTYDIRYSTSLITAVNWASATQVVGEPAPQVAGTVQTLRVHGLNWNTTYYFAMKTSDEVPNISTLSNSLSLTTRTQASYLIINTATARSNAPANNTQMINITMQNSATEVAESSTINQMSATWASSSSTRLNTIRISGVNYWAGTATKGILVTLSPAFVLAPATNYSLTYLDYNNSVIGLRSNVIQFVLSDGSILNSSSFNITQ